MKKLVITADQAEKIDLYLENGADEVVLGLDGFSIGAFAKQSLNEANNRVEVSWLMNRPLFPQDVKKAEVLLQELAERSFAYIYYADISLLYLAERYGLKDRMIYRPETLVTGTEDALFWKSQGIASVSISPLLTKQEILEIVQSVSDCEVTVFGHQWLSISARQLIRSYYATYEKPLPEYPSFFFQEKSRDYKMPIHEDENGTLTYTDYVLDSFDELLDFMHAGVTRFYMDAVYLPEEAVLDALRLHRAILNGEEADVHAFRDRWASLHLATGYYHEKTVL